jgi:hypothetical protein
MVREYVHLASLAALLPACSLILDFSDGAAPADAAIDAVYTQAECDYKEPNDTIGTAAPITTSDTGPAAICARAPGEPEDRDFYKFTVAGSSVVTLSITFTNRPGGDLDLKLYDATSTVIAQSRGFSDGEALTCPGAAPACPALADGDYVFEVLPGVMGAVNNYTFALGL